MPIDCGTPIPGTTTAPCCRTGGSSSSPLAPDGPGLFPSACSPGAHGSGMPTSGTRTYGRRVTLLPQPEHLPTTLGALRASGHEYRTVKDEIRANLLARMRSGDTRFPGVVGFDETVLPDLERALLAGHDVVLLGERGQGKTRLIRTIAGLLDEWTPVIAGAELHEHPYSPITPASLRRGAPPRRRPAG